MLTVLLIALLSWTAWAVVLNRLSPILSVELALFLFFVTLFIALTCTFTVFGYYFRLGFLHKDYLKRNINVSLRQGALLSFMVVFVLIFQLNRVLTWWSGILLILMILGLEYYFSLREEELL